MNLRYAIAAALAAGTFITIPIARADNSSHSDRSGRIDQEFTKLDKNNDGNIDQTEAQARPWLQKNFSQYDTNHDGKLGKDEFAAAASAQRTARAESRGASGASNRGERGFDRLDKNHDGSIDQTEAQAWPKLQQNFSQYDTNHDGKLGKDEFAAAVSAQRAASGDTDHDRRGHGRSDKD